MMRPRGKRAISESNDDGNDDDLKDFFARESLLSVAVHKSCSRLKLLLFRLFGLFLSASPAEHVRHRVIRLMARVLEKLVAGFLRDGKGDLPGPDEDLRIVNGQFIVHRVRVNTREAFNKTKGVARRYGIATVSPDTRRVIQEIRRLDDQGVALPMAT